MINNQSRPSDIRGSRQARYPALTGAGPGARTDLVRALRDVGESRIAGEVAKCCSHSLQGAGVTLYEGARGSRYFKGLLHCNRMLCPICAPYLMSKRVKAMRLRAENLARDPGLRHFLLTLSVQHGQESDWKSRVKALKAIQASLQGSRRWKGLVEGFARVLESTHGSNGHHPHEHVLLTLRVAPGWDSASFFVWARGLGDKASKRHGVSSRFTEGWWREIPAGDLVRAVSYFGHSQKWGQPSSISKTDPTDQGPEHLPIWAIPARAFSEVWQESKGVRWFGTGGCWRGVLTDSDEKPAPNSAVLDVLQSDPALDCHQTPILHIPGEVWRSWSPSVRRERQAFLCHPMVRPEDLLAHAISWDGLTLSSLGQRAAPSDSTGGSTCQSLFLLSG